MELHADRDCRAIRYLRCAAEGRQVDVAGEYPLPEVHGALALGRSRASRLLIRLEHDSHGQRQAVEEQVTVAIGRCRACGHRCRVLPSDVLPAKTYALSVIEYLAASYVDGAGSLRRVAWSLLGERTPQHTTLHAWTEGLGAHVLGRDATRGEPHSAMVAETTARWPLVASVTTRSIDPRRFRSEPRHERLSAVATLVQMARAIPDIDAAMQLADWRRLAIGFGGSSPLSFRTGRACTPTEQLIPVAAQARAACPSQRSKPSASRTRSPPGASSRSLPSSIPRSDTRSDGA